MTYDAPAISAGSSPAGSLTTDRTDAVAVRRFAMRDLRSVAALQKRAFKPRLAYGLGTLVVLWLLPRTRFVVATASGDVVGCAIGDEHGGHSRVVNICVDPTCQGRGIGSRLLGELERALPLGDMVLMVERSNDRARRLYRKEGYAEITVSQNYYGAGFDGVWMQKRRTPGPDLKIRV